MPGLSDKLYVQEIMDLLVYFTNGGNMPKTKAKVKDNKTSRFGMRVAPQTKELWEATAKEWGYKSTSEWIEAMANWAIQYEKFEGNYDQYLKAVANG